MLISFFFTHPYAAWERGTNENINGLIRQYIPNSLDLSAVTNHRLLQIQNKLHHRPKNCLDFMSPSEVFLQLSVALTN
jgi:IS30 family transposase